MAADSYGSSEPPAMTSALSARNLIMVEKAGDSEMETRFRRRFQGRDPLFAV
jgi:hypothetical protein